MENKDKQLLVMVSPIATVSGYGSRSRDLARAILALDKYNVQFISTRWGGTPLNALVSGQDDDIISRLVANVTTQPDIFIQVSVPNEFQAIGKFNIGVTAGIETTMCAAPWLEGLNKMDLNIVPSQHSKHVFEITKYDKVNNNTKQKEGELALIKPIEVLFEGVNVNIYKKTDELNKSILEQMSAVKEQFAFLFTGHYMVGDMGEDRKNVGMMIKCFLEAFKNVTGAPALVLKVSGGTFSHIDRLELLRKINMIKKSVKATRLPNVYLLHGDLTESEMNSLNMHPKIKAHITLTKGEGYGRPLAEFAMTGKPIVATNWSGHIDFLNKDYVTLIPGKLTPVHKSAQWDNVIIKDSQWFTADYGVFVATLRDVYKNYDGYLEKSRKMTKYMKDNFSWDIMKDKLGEILGKIPAFPKAVQQIQLPQLKRVGDIPKINLPKLKKVESEA